MSNDDSDDQKRILDVEQITDLKNVRGCGIPWVQLSKHYGSPIDELRRLAGLPQFRDVDGGVQ